MLCLVIPEGLYRKDQVKEHLNKSCINLGTEEILLSHCGGFESF